MSVHILDVVQVKCEVYWPREVGSSSVHGHLDLTLAAVTTLADYSIRTLVLQKVSLILTWCLLRDLCPLFRLAVVKILVR